jgi:hypothetical protein
LPTPTPEEFRLAAPLQRCEDIDDLDAGFEDP